MTLTQSWIGYLDRSYEQIKQSCLTRLGILAPEISDHSESNPLIIILSMFSGIGEMINLYIDSAAREAYLGTTRKYESAVKLVRLIDYNIRAINPATVNLKFYLVDSNNNPAPLPNGFLLIPLGTVVNSINGAIPFVLDNDIKITSGNQNIFGSASQYTPVSGDILGNTDGSTNQVINLPNNYADGSLKITINNETWVAYRSFGTMYPDTKGFVVNIDENSQAYFSFGDGVNGAIPTTGQTVFGDYHISNGASGNIPPNQITQIVGTIPGVPTGLTLLVTNPDYASGGENFESLQDIQNRAPRSIRTLERAVTYQDYLDLCYLVLGVGAAELSYCCGKYIDVYIAPSSPGAATLGLIQSVQDYLNCRIMITTKVAVQPSGVSKIWISGIVNGKPLASSSDIYNQVVTELDNVYGYATLKINKKISIPGIIATIEGLSLVDSFELDILQILPYCRPLNTNQDILNITFNNLPKTKIPYTYTIRWSQAINQFIIYKGSYEMMKLPIGGTYGDDVCSFTLNTGTYTNGDVWEFTAFPSYPEIFPAVSVNINDYSAPLIDVSPYIDNATTRTIYSNLTIQTQGTSSNCLPPCN